MLARILGWLFLSFWLALPATAQYVDNVNTVAGPGEYAIRVNFQPVTVPTPVGTVYYTATCGSASASGFSPPIMVNTGGTPGTFTCTVSAVDNYPSAPANSYSGTSSNSVTLPFVDATPPTLISGPSIAPYATYADLSVAYNVAVKLYQLVVPAGGASPTPSQIENPATYTAGPAYYPANYYAAPASAVSTIPTANTLSPGTAYTLHLLAKKYTGTGYLVSSANFTTTGSATPFVFNPVSNATPGAEVISDPATWDSASATLSISDGEYSINGGPFTASSGTVNQGDSVRIKVIAATDCNGSRTATVTAAAKSANFVVSSQNLPSCAACLSVVEDTDLFTFCQTKMTAGETCTAESPQRSGSVGGLQTEKRIFCRSASGGSTSGRATWSNYSDQADVLVNGSVTTSFDWSSSDGGTSYAMQSFKLDGSLTTVIAGITHGVVYNQLLGTLTTPPLHPSYTVGATTFNSGIVTISGTVYANIGTDWTYWPPLPKAFTRSLPVNLDNATSTETPAAPTPGTDLPPAPPPTGSIEVPNVNTGGTDIQPVTNTNQVFSQPGTGVIVNNYIVEVVTGQTLVVSPTATPGAAVRIVTAAPVVVETGGSRVTVQATGTSQPVFQVATIDGAPALVPTAGDFSMTAAAGGATLPLAGGSAGSAVLQAQDGGTRIDASIGVGANSPLMAAVTSGTVQFHQTTRSRATPTNVTVHAGEAMNVDRTTGALDTLRFGTLKQNSGQPGDYIANIPFGDSTLTVPIVSGTVQRFGDTLNLVVARAIASHVGLDPTRVTGLSQDTASGVITLTTTVGNYRYLPVGSVQIDLEQLLRAVSAADIAANLERVVAEGLLFAIAPATSTQDLQTALRQIDPTATVKIASDGIARVKVNNYDYAVQPAPQLTQASPGAASLIETNGSLALRDTAGNVQTLYAAFAELDNVKSTFQGSDTNFAIANNRDGTYRATYGGTAYTLKPVLRVVWPFPARTEAWWQDADKLFVRYPNGQAQEFAVQ